MNITLEKCEYKGMDKALFKDLAEYDYVDEWLDGIMHKKAQSSFLNISVSFNCMQEEIIRNGMAAENAYDIVHIISSLPERMRQIPNDAMEIKIDAFERSLDIIQKRFDCSKGRPVQAYYIYDQSDNSITISGRDYVDYAGQYADGANGENGTVYPEFKNEPYNYFKEINDAMWHFRYMENCESEFDIAGTPLDTVIKQMQALGFQMMPDPDNPIIKKE